MVLSTPAPHPEYLQSVADRRDGRVLATSWEPLAGGTDLDGLACITNAGVQLAIAMERKSADFLTKCAGNYGEIGRAHV